MPKRKNWLAIAAGTGALIAACGEGNVSSAPGTGGNGGTGGDGAGNAGSGGSGEPDSGAERCEPAMTCGNGLLESCRLVSCSGALCDRKEECEEPLAGESCESIGYAAGTLACSACAYDASECTSCLPGSSVLGCQVLSGYTTSRSIALETTTQEVAVAWD